MTRHGRPTWRGIGRGLALAGAALALTAVNTDAASVAHQARVVSVNDTGDLKLLHASGEVLLEEGSVSGTLPGGAKVRLEIGATIRASFTIKPDGGGSISGTGRATPTSSGRYTSFGGTLSVTRGTGRYAHAHGSGKLYGKIERVHDTLTVQTREGTLDYQ
jgi:hypothetical protein